MKLAKTIIALLVMCSGSQLLAENWVTVFSFKGLFTGDLRIDKDSIHLGKDNLAYFTESWDGSTGEGAVDCQKRILYSVKAVAGAYNPNWRAEGSAVLAGSNGEKELNFICANAS
jgi:hypothetical protein